MPGISERDHFAAAALTGLLARGLLQSNLLAADAYKVADAMLCERCRGGGDCPGQDNAPTHGAAPAARADLPDERPPHAVSANGGTPSAASRDGNGTGDTQEPAAWAVLRVGGGWVSILANKVQAETSRASFDKMENWVHEVVPLYRRPHPTLTDAEREAIYRASQYLSQNDVFEGMAEDAATLRGLLERLGGGR